MTDGVISTCSNGRSLTCDHQLYVLLWNFIGATAIIGWSGITSGILFASLKYIGMLRVDEDTELRGLDIKKHGESAYPQERSMLVFLLLKYGSYRTGHKKVSIWEWVGT